MKLMRTPWQFTLRQLWMGLTILCVCIWLLSRWYSRYRAQDTSMDAIYSHGGYPRYYLQADEHGGRSSRIVDFVADLEQVSFLDRDMFFQVTELSYEGFYRTSDENIAS